MGDVRRRQACEREDAAFQRMDRLSVDASDLEIAEAMAEYYLTAYPDTKAHYKGRISLSKLHDVRLRSTAPPCPIEYDWRRKNTVGITTTDEGRARDWAIRAMLLGYAVFCCWGSRGNRWGFAGSQGSIEAWRKHERELREKYPHRLEQTPV